ncbi:MAG: LamG-like jellyroll fold domain-containing protein [Oceanidesulfovibrio sp.]
MAIPREGLVLELLGELDGSNILDTSEHSDHAVVEGVVEVEHGGHPLGDAIVFDGSNAVALPFGALIQGASPRTVSLWFHREANLSGEYETLYNAGSRQVLRWFNITLGPGTLEFLNYGYGAENTTVHFDYAGAWHWVCFHYDGAVKRAWIDGALVLEQSISLDTGGAYHELAQREGGYRFHGRLARLRIWNRALDEAEIAAVYNESGLQCSTVRYANILGPDTARLAMATGLGRTVRGMSSTQTLGLDICGLFGGSLGGAASRIASLGLGDSAIAPATANALGAQRLLAEPARLGRSGHLAFSCGIVGPGSGAVIRHRTPLAGMGQGLTVRQPYALAGPAGLTMRSAMDLADQPSRRRSHAVRVFLDGEEVTSAVVQCDLRMALDAPHDEISVILGRGNAAIDTVLKERRPLSHSGTSRLEVHIDGASHIFLLETCEQHVRTLRLGGRTLSALAESPYAEAATVEGGVLASEAARSLAESCGLDIAWSTHDWLLPESWIGSGPPMDSLRRLAAAVGAFLRWDGENGRLIALHAHSAAIVQSIFLDCATMPMLDGSCAAEPGTGRNAVTVLGHAAEIDLPRLEVEPHSPDLPGHLRGAPATVLAHWPAGRSSTAWTWASHGSVDSLGEGLLMRRNVPVPFVMGRARLDESPVSLERVRWLGASAGGVRLSPGGSELLCDSGRSGVALLDYAVLVQRFLLSGHDVPALVFLVASTAPDRTGVRVIHGHGQTREEDMPIEDPLLTDRASAVARGRAHLAWRSRPRRVFTVTMPYRAVVAPGVVVGLDHGEVDASGPCLVRAAHIEAHGPKLVHHLDLVQWTD